MKTTDRTALVIGGTGLVGSCLVEQLLADAQYSKVVLFVRKATGLSHEKLEENVIDFDDITAWRDKVRGDVLFSAMGTTLKQAGSKIEQFKVDFTYQYQFAYIASQNKVPVYVLVSAAGAGTEAYIFYSKIKGMLEDEVKKLRFDHVVILQPGPLKGEREQGRLGEKAGVFIMGRLNALGLFRKYRPIGGDEMAAAMIRLAEESSEKEQTVTLDAIFPWAESASAGT
ncbi:MAG: NAD(P)H-binding protein [Mucilaginibacter polytrichastri]|nr:NAD(P)H-binding protein [Mucilaginibacter polytrichastri]